ncbi:MAG: tetratricopeptide repeat protein [Polyangiaceae bacterium]|nr:tetratricopeptide repeat protein [Polyangiaceae bacterium]
MNVRRAWQAAVFGGLVACGGGGGGAAPPAQSATSAAAGLDNATPKDAPGSSQGAPSPEFLAGVKAFDAGHFDDARTSFQAAAKKNPNDSDALFNLGATCEKLDDKAGAEQAYKAAIAAKPDLDAAAAALSALYLDMNRTDDALAVARAGLAKRPGSAPLHENLAVALAVHGSQDEAVKEFEQALHITPTEPMYHLTLAHWLNAWHVKGAVPHLDTARNLAKDDYGMTASVGHEYRMAGEFESCVQTFDHAVSIKDGGEVRTERALCRLGLKDEKGTLEDLQAAVGKEPTYAPAHYYLAGRLALDKKFKDAAAEYQKYLGLAPQGSLARQATERLKVAQEAAKAPPKKR